MKKLVKKEVTKYFSFGLDGINDEWCVEDDWEGFTKYKNRDNLIIVTFKSPDAITAINNLKEDDA